MSLSASTAARCSSCAAMRLALWSSTWVPSITTRSFNSREYRSKARSPPAVCSNTVGTKYDMHASSSRNWMVACYTRNSMVAHVERSIVLDVPASRVWEALVEDPSDWFDADVEIEAKPG